MKPGPTADVTAVLEGLMPPSEYVAREGMYCPKCKAKETGPVADMHLVAPNTAHYERKCHACDFTWTEVYSLSSYRTDR